MSVSAFEKVHHYGSFFHWVGDPFHDHLLTDFCSAEVGQPRVMDLAKQMSRYLMIEAIKSEFQHGLLTRRTRMSEMHSEAIVEAKGVASENRVVVVDLLRAGIIPSQMCFETLHDVLPATRVRQDHVLLNRKTDDSGHVVGVNVSGEKIGGDVDDALIVIADPMGATGTTLHSVIDIYDRLDRIQSSWGGKARKFIALHFIVTPEYLKNVSVYQDRLSVFALRVDRGLSSKAVLKLPFGQKWSEERGLNERGYIVPGAGGIGEILNNAEV